VAYSCQKAILIHALADWRTETFMNGSERGAVAVKINDQFLKAVIKEK